jgi:hypothetical protein
MATDTMIDTSALRPVLIICDGGLVRDVLNLQPGQEYELFDADVLENGGSEAADYWDDLNEEMRAVALDRYENWATEARRLSGLRKTGPDYQARRERLEALVNAHGGAAAIGNGYEISEKPLRYLGIEWRGPDLIWAYSADTVWRQRFFPGILIVAAREIQLSPITTPSCDSSIASTTAKPRGIKQGWLTWTPATSIRPC